ncbi:unnamed protein product, partial [Oppiella nova]
AVRVCQCVLLGHVVHYFQTEGSVSSRHATISAVGIVVCSAYFVTSNHIDFVYLMRVGLRMRAACCALMYRKAMRLSHSSLGQTPVGQIINMMSNDVNRFDEAMRLSHSSLGQTPVGQIINMMSNDVNRFDEFAFFLQSLFVAPLHSALVIYLLWERMEWACLAGMAVLLLFIPFQLLMGRMFQRARRNTAKLTDTRIKLMSEIISGMRVIKMYAWEQPFAQLVSEARRKEIHGIRQSSFLKGINLSLSIITVRIILFVCFLTYILMGRKLSAEVVFVSMSFFNTMRWSVTKFFPSGVAATAELMVVINRIQVFIIQLIRNVQKICMTETMGKCVNDGEKGVFVDKLTARWSDESVEPTLKDISVCVKPGELLAIVGSSSLLLSILNELPLESGSVGVRGRVSYAPQESWAFIGSVRQNIVFGSQYMEEKYNRVVKACALDRDFKRLAFGDQTLVGERGVSLSGGQRARVSLARALYHSADIYLLDDPLSAACALDRDFKRLAFGDQTLVGERGVSLSGGQRARVSLARALYHSADIYLLDDPLSAVDIHVAKHLFQKCCMEYLKDKARILVTHQIQFLRDAHKILVLDDGKCVALGSYDELMASGINLMSYHKPNEDLHHKPDPNMAYRRVNRSVPSSPSISRCVGEGSVVTGNDNNVNIVDIKEEREEQRVKSETKMTGSVETSVYWEYIKAGAGPTLFIVTVLSAFIVQVLYQGGDTWLTRWTNSESDAKPVDETFSLMVYSCLIAALLLSALISTACFYAMCMRSSYDMIRNVQKFGRILNRFTKDTGIVDELLPSIAFDFIISILLVVGNLIVNAIVNWYLVFPAALLLLLVFMGRYFYIRAARDIKRLEGLSRSPVYSHVSTTLTGLTSIRAFGTQDVFERQFECHQNANTSASFLLIVTARAFGFLMDWICVLYISAVVAFIMTSDGITDGYAGLVLSCCMEYLKDKARILVTHQIQFLRDAHKILVLADGKCVALGSYDELMASGINLMSSHKPNEDLHHKPDPNIAYRRVNRSVPSSPPISRCVGEGSVVTGNDNNVDIVDNKEEGEEQRVKSETKMTGSVETSVYWEYTKAGAGPSLFIVTVLSAITVQVLYQGGDIWLARWTNAESDAKPADETFNLMYSCLIAALLLSALISTACFYVMCMRSSVKLYNSIFYALLRAPISFFDSQPIGRILNRFTKDTGIVDELLPSIAFDFIISILLVIGNLIVNAIVNWYLVFPAALLLLLVFMGRYFYIRAARDIKRLEGMSRSPVYSHVNTTLTGLTSIRAFGAQDVFERQFECHQNDNTSASFLLIVTARAFAFLMDWICIFYISAVVAFIMRSDGITDGYAGLVLSSALTLTGMTQYAIKCSADLESHMTAVERIVEYSRITPEAALESTADRKPPPDWPQNGEIVLKDMSLRYNESANKVLKGVTVCLKGGEKVGVVGRTGAGKSSLISALFRLTEPEGQVLIDGVDVRAIGLHDLRRRISIIPQEPTLFTGSVRRNLDPFGDRPDDQLW